MTSTTTCTLFRRHASVFVDGELDPKTQLELEQHAASCASCRDHLAFEHAYRLHVREALVAPVSAPASLRERCLLALDREPERKPAPSRRYAVASAAAVLVVGVVALGQNMRHASAEDVASREDIDTAVKLGLNHPMGPLELSDYIGLDTMLLIAESMTDALGERFRAPQTLRKLVEAGHLGRKSGRGFYDYGDN